MTSDIWNLMVLKKKKKVRNTRGLVRFKRYRSMCLKHFFTRRLVADTMDMFVVLLKSTKTIKSIHEQIRKFRLLFFIPLNYFQKKKKSITHYSIPT